MRFIGIDPGKSGGIAYIDEQFGRGCDVAVFKMPETRRALLALLRDITEHNALQTATTVEQVWAMPRIDRGGKPVGMGATSAFSFGKGFGELLGILDALDIVFIEVAPIKWQNVLGVRTSRERREELGHKDKNAHKLMAEYILAQLKTSRITVTHAVADAVLLAEYSRRTYSELFPMQPAKDTTNGKTRRNQTPRGQGQEGRKEKRPTGPAA